MNVVLVVTLFCILTVPIVFSQDEVTRGPGPGARRCHFDHCHLPKIPGCCTFFIAFRKEMDDLKKDPTQSCNRFSVYTEMEGSGRNMHSQQH
uniref:U19-Theraphotoxin-Ct1a_1 n=1 Tax=Coremiocnemis tropix TaxID=1904443 RepID=A0A482ZBE5_CORTR